MNAESMIYQYKAYLIERIKQYEEAKGFFTKQLAYYFSIMPAPTRVLDINTGKWTMVNDYKWQALVDITIKMANEYLEKEFPEFNNF